MKYKKDWDNVKNKWTDYWNRENKGRPLMYIVADRPELVNSKYQAELKSKGFEDKYLNAERIAERYRYYCETHEFMAESFPNVSVDLGPGSMAAYLGCDVKESGNSIWYEHFVEDWGNYKEIKFDPQAQWFKKHLDTYKKVRDIAGDDFYVGIPDIIENLDILSSMRGTQDIIFDMIDNPQEIKKRIKQIDDIYFEYYDRFYDTAQNNNGGSCYTVFQIWGEGKTAKLQCDFSALLSQDYFNEFVVPSLRAQAKKLDNVLYHLDGPDAIKHMPALMEIEEIDALQWTSGDYNPDGTFEQWYEIYDMAVLAGKGLWVRVYTGEYEEWLERIDRLVERYGSNALFLFFPQMSVDKANELIAYADKNWSDIKGSILSQRGNNE